MRERVNIKISFHFAIVPIYLIIKFAKTINNTEIPCTFLQISIKIYTLPLVYTKSGAVFLDFGLIYNFFLNIFQYQLLVKHHFVS
jgi:hypothetical protein